MFTGLGEIKQPCFRSPSDWILVRFSFICDFAREDLSCFLEHFVVEWDQQRTEDEQAGKSVVGIMVGKSGVAVVCLGWLAM